MSVGENIRFYRKKAKLTQAQLAEKSHTSTSYIQQLERGEKNNVSSKYLKCLADALNIGVESFFNDTPKTIGHLIKDAREEKGLKQSDLSNLVCIPASSICNYEKGNRTPDLNVLSTIAKALDKPVNYFYQSYIEPQQEQKVQENTINLKSMSAGEIKQLIFEATNELINRI